MNTNILFNKWKEKTIKFFELIKNQIGSEEIDIDIKDDFCLFSNKNDFNSKYQLCEECKKLSFISGKNYFEEEFLLEYGRRKGEKIFINSYDFYLKRIKNNDNLRKFNNNITQRISKFYPDEFYNIDNINYYSVKDKFFNLYLIIIILNTIFFTKKISIEGYNYSYFCNNKIYFIRMKNDFEDIRNLTYNPLYITSKTQKNLSFNILLNILQQLVIFNKIFENFYFTHNEASIDFLKFSSDIFNINLLDKNFQFPIKVIILPSTYSSISIYNKNKKKWARFLNFKSDRENLYPFEKIDFFINGSKNYNKIKLGIPYSKDYLNKRIVFYKIGNRYEDFIFLRRHLGCTVVSKSFDLICFIISIIIDESVLSTFLNSPELMTIWEGFWKPGEGKEILKKIKFFSDKDINSFDDIFLLIKDYYIRFDLLDYLWEELFKL